MNTNQALNARQQSIVAIAALTAKGDLERLRASLHEGLDAGLTVNEIKEILVQMYAYAGFPRSLNAIHTFMDVMDARQAQDIEDDEGKDAGPIPADLDKDAYGAQVRAELAGWQTIPEPRGYQRFTPVIDTFLKEHLFADIFARDVLDHRSRELATMAALAAMTGTAGQLRFHLGAAMNTGLTGAQLRAFVSVLEARVGDDEAERANEGLRDVLGDKA